MKTVAIIGLVLILPLALEAGDPAVVQQLRRDVVGKTFVLATNVAGNTCLYTGTLDFPTSRLVDTEIARDGGPRYYLRADRFLNIRNCSNPVGRVPDTLASGQYIDSSMITRMYGSGSRVTVKRVEAKSDRIELQLTPEGASSGDNSYAKLKLMLGNNFESLGLEQIEMFLAHAVILPRINLIQEERTKLVEVRASITQLESELAADKSAETRVDEATQLLTQYQKEMSAEERLNSVAFEPVSVEQFTPRIAELNAIIAEGKRQAALDRIQRATDNYQSSTLLMKASCERISDSPAKSREELTKSIALVEAAQRSLETFHEAETQMVTLGQGISTDAKEYYARCLAASDGVAQTFDSQRASFAQAEAKAVEQQRKQALRVAAERDAQERREAAAEKARQAAQSVGKEPTKPLDQNCYDDHYFSIVTRHDAKTRMSFAMKLADGDQQNGIFVKAAGEDNKYLLFSSSPENESVLMQIASFALSSESEGVRANYCVQGFAEVQFIVRGDDGSQRLLRRYKTSFQETWKYVNRVGGATPVE
jgi:hypothetical protein